MTQINLNSPNNTNKSIYQDYKNSTIGSNISKPLPQHKSHKIMTNIPSKESLKDQKSPEFAPLKNISPQSTEEKIRFIANRMKWKSKIKQENLNLYSPPKQLSTYQMSEKLEQPTCPQEYLWHLLANSKKLKTFSKLKT